MHAQQLALVIVSMNLLRIHVHHCTQDTDGLSSYASMLGGQYGIWIDSTKTVEPSRAKLRSVSWVAWSIPFGTVSRQKPLRTLVIDADTCSVQEGITR